MYAYKIWASLHQAWHMSNWARIKHTVLWQSLIDGWVTLQPTAGCLPVQGIKVDYILKDLNSNKIVLGCTNKTVDGWCQMETSASGKFFIEFSLNHPLLNNYDDFPVHMRFSKTTRLWAFQIIMTFDGTPMGGTHRLSTGEMIFHSGLLSTRIVWLRT